MRRGVGCDQRLQSGIGLIGLVGMDRRIDLFQHGARGIRNDRQIGRIGIFITAAAMMRCGEAGYHGCHHGGEFVMALADLLGRALDGELVDAFRNRQIAIVADPGHDLGKRRVPGMVRQEMFGLDIALERGVAELFVKRLAPSRISRRARRR